MTKLLFILVLVNVFAFCYLQLITPMMACEMKCLQDKDATNVLYNSDEAKECREYCLHHAYDFLHQLG